MTRALQAEFTKKLQSEIAGEVRTDPATRWLYSTDASIYQIEPLGVVFPRRLDDLETIVGLCAQEGVAIIPRGSGSGLAGQSLGEALIVDCSRYLDKLEHLDVQNHEAWVQPGLILDALNKEAGRFGLQFGPDPASAERATLGGCLANNATGAHSIIYGMAADHLLEVEVVLGDGSVALFGSKPLDVIASDLSRTDNAYSHLSSIKNSEIYGLKKVNELYQAAVQIREGWASEIKTRWPKTWRKAAGYNLNYLLPWSPGAPPGWERQAQHRGRKINYPPHTPDTINLAPLFAGSEGALGVIRRAKLRLVERPKYTVLAVAAYESIIAACDAAPEILQFAPSAIELIPGSILELSKSVPAYAAQVEVFKPLEINQMLPAAVLAVEFSGENQTELIKQAEPVLAYGKTFLAVSKHEQQKVWNVRKVGLGILLSRPGDLKPWSFIEDLSVPVERLGTFVRSMDEILSRHQTSCEIYAHASAGCLHIRPFLNLKTTNGRHALRSIAEQAVELTLSLGGSISGEHGLGLARSEWLERMLGSKLMDAMRLLKQAADPSGILNPGKVVPAGGGVTTPRMDENLRFGQDYHTKDAWLPNLDFSRQGGLSGAIEQCNGAGVCRKSDGLMCPSFQATREEMHSTRGRANLLRALISGKLKETHWGLPAVKQAMDLCLACKGCKAECPSAVDVAKLRYEFLDWLHQKDGGGEARRSRDYLFAYIGDLARVGHAFGPFANFVTQSDLLRPLRRAVGLTVQRQLPGFSKNRLSRLTKDLWVPAKEARKNNGKQQRTVFFLNDAFSEHFYPEAGAAGLKLLRATGTRVFLLPVQGAGRTLISKGFLDAARKHARQLIDVLERLDPSGEIPVIGVEPSEIYSLCDEYLNLFPEDDYVCRLSKRAYTIEEYLIRLLAQDGEMDNLLMRVANYSQKSKITHLTQTSNPILYHAHCYQKARKPSDDGFPSGAQATLAFFEKFGQHVELVEAGCCGMAGAFGYEEEHYEVSMQVGELALFPAVRKAGQHTIISASGVSCQAQIKDGTGRKAYHPVEVVADALGLHRLES